MCYSGGRSGTDGAPEDDSEAEIAAQLGHNPTVCLDTYAHVMAEQRGAEPVSAEQEILMARGRRAAAQAQLALPGLE